MKCVKFNMLYIKVKLYKVCDIFREIGTNNSFEKIMFKALKLIKLNYDFVREILYIYKTSNYYIFLFSPPDIYSLNLILFIIYNFLFMTFGAINFCFINFSWKQRYHDVLKCIQT